MRLRHPNVHGTSLETHLHCLNRLLEHICEGGEHF